MCKRQLLNWGWKRNGTWAYRQNFTETWNILSALHNVSLSDNFFSRNRNWSKTATTLNLLVNLCEVTVLNKINKLGNEKKGNNYSPLKQFCHPPPLKIICFGCKFPNLFSKKVLFWNLVGRTIWDVSLSAHCERHLNLNFLSVRGGNQMKIALCTIGVITASNKYWQYPPFRTIKHMSHFFRRTQSKERPFLADREPGCVTSY